MEGVSRGGQLGVSCFGRNIPGFLEESLLTFHSGQTILLWTQLQSYSA